jgi:anti-sigma regulatory factor (Ser/Thr protein kinase)
MRQWLRSLLPDCAALEDVLTVASELAANAVCHTRTGRGGWFAVEITWVPELVRVAVADLGGISIPALREDPDGVHGRGLILTRALSTRTGVLGDHNGRKVWADIAWNGPEPRQLVPPDARR